MVFMLTLNRRVFLSGVTGLIGCGGSLKHFPFDLGDNPSTGLQITYYSVGCYRIKLDEIAILTDPFWSHLPFLQVAFGKSVTDPKQFTPYIDQLRSVEIVLVGHSHYDHVMDLEAAAPHLAPQAKIYGGKTLKHIYAATDIPRPIIPVNDKLATLEKAGTWIYNETKTVRFLPIYSNHPTQYLFFHLYKNTLHKDAKHPPKHVSDYQEGATIAYLIDYLDTQNEEIRCRIYVQTSTTGYPAGFFPQSIIDERSVDVALLSMDCANIKVDGKKQSIIDYINPKAVVFCHWEDFFRPKSLPPREIVKVNMAKLKKHLPSTDSTRYIFPNWDTHYYFDVETKNK